MAAACSGAGDSLTSIVDGEVETTTTAAEVSGSESGEIVEVEIALPFVPPIAVPDVSVLNETGDLVQDRLGDLITPVSGVDLISADCSADDGDLIYQGSTGGTDVFDIETDGSGEYYDETDAGVVSLDVAGDGSGVFYDSSRGGVISIAVEADGSGEYYSEQPEGLVTIRVGPEGTGEYYDERNDGLLTINLGDDGAAQYYAESEDGLLTINVDPDGAAEYYRTSPTDGLMTIDVEPDGSWRLTRTTSSRNVEVFVEPDGSGRYLESGRTSAEFAFDPEGRADGYSITLPPAPTFAVSGSFPPLGRLGSLAPRCATVIRFDSELLFDFNSAEIRSDADEVLVQVVAALNETGKPIEVNGHSDSIGGAEYNLELSLERAQAVDAALRERGLTVEVEVNGYGEERPVAPNETEDGQDDPAGRALNRRVEIVIRD